MSQEKNRESVLQYLRSNKRTGSMDASFSRFNPEWYPTMKEWESKSTAERADEIRRQQVERAAFVANVRASRDKALAADVSPPVGPLVFRAEPRHQPVQYMILFGVVLLIIAILIVLFGSCRAQTFGIALAFVAIICIVSTICFVANVCSNKA